MKSGIFLSKWRPLHVSRNFEWEICHQIVVPTMCQPIILSLTHETPLAGHLGVRKTHAHILPHFSWYGLKQRINKYCRTCHICQIAGKPNQGPQKVPLKPISVTDKPFSHLIIDCVSSLPETGSGKLLTVMCSATRFPEAFPLRNIEAKTFKELFPDVPS